MITIVAGSRNIADYATVAEAIIESGFEITMLIHGAARGVDTLAGMWALNNGIPTLSYPADWDKYGKSAGPIRNREMAKNAKALIAIWNGSRGTADMIKVAEKASLKVFIKHVT